MPLTKVEDPTIEALATALAEKTAEADTLRKVLVNEVVNGPLDEGVLTVLGIEVPSKVATLRVTLDVPVNPDEIGDLKSTAKGIANVVRDYSSAVAEDEDNDLRDVTVVNFEVV